MLYLRVEHFLSFFKMTRILKFKFKLFFAHLALSIFLFGGFLFFLTCLWYPNPLWKAVGVINLILIIFFIDTVIGPCLSFIIGSPQKKSLRLDLSIIAVLQICAFIYGVFTLMQGRPAWLVYDVDRFELVRANEIHQKDLQKVNKIYRYPGFLGPIYVDSQAEFRNSDEAKQQMLEEITTGIGPAQRPEFYRPISNSYKKIQQRALPLKNLSNFNDKAMIDNQLDIYPEADAYLPLKSNSKDMTVLISRNPEVKIIAIVDLRPWK